MKADLVVKNGSIVTPEATVRGGVAIADIVTIEGEGAVGPNLAVDGNVRRVLGRLALRQHDDVDWTTLRSKRRFQPITDRRPGSGQDHHARHRHLHQEGKTKLARQTVRHGLEARQRDQAGGCSISAIR